MYKIFHGDCLDKMKKIASESVDLILTDPPYGTTACEWDSIIPLDLMWSELYRIIKPNGAIVMTSCQPFTTTLINSNLKDFRYCWVWNKKKAGNFQLCKKMPLKVTEDVVVFYKKLPPYYPQGLKRLEKPLVQRNEKKKGRLGHFHSLDKRKIHLQEFTNYPSNLIEFGLDKGLHPTQKPVGLMEYLVRTYTRRGETVLDFTMGSGSTGVACMNTGRNFIGIELDPKYFGIAQRRIREALARVRGAKQDV